MRKTFALAAAGLLMMALAAASEPPSLEKRHTQIPAQGLGVALQTLAKDRGFQVLYVSTDINKHRTQGASGDLTSEEALKQLLAGTGLTFRYLGENSVTIVPIKDAASSSNEQLGMDATGDIQDQIRLARSSEAQAQQPPKTEAQNAALKQSEQQEQEVVVTGSHIRGSQPNAGVISISAEQISQTGFASAQDWIETMPQSFGSVPNEESGGLGNFNRGTGVNLRGLGAGATLVLVNGRRQPASGLDGDFVDISGIPASAIDRVEVLTDGASAIYGSDAIGGVVNFVLRKNFEGAETRIRYAAADGGGEEKIAEQLLGLAWSSGQALFDYQYYERSALPYSARDFAASSDKRPFGGDDFRTINSNPGNILNGSNPVYAIPSNQNGRGLTVNNLLPGVVNRQNVVEGAWLLPERTMHSAFLTLSQDIGDRWQVFAEGRFSRRDSLALLPALNEVLFVPSTNPFAVNPLNRAFVQVAYDFIDDFGADAARGRTQSYTGTAGATVDFASNWQASISQSLGSETLDFSAPTIDEDALDAALNDPNPQTAFNPFGDGSFTNPVTLASIRGLQLEHGQSRIASSNLIADGPVFDAPGGQSKLAVGVDYRREELDRGVTTRTEFSRNISTGFAELSLPLVGGGHSRFGLHELSVSAAGRFENYSDFGDTFNPKLSIRLAPLESLGFHASWGTSFRAPKLVDLDDRSRATNMTAGITVRDPLASTGFSQVLLLLGGNSALTEETSRARTIGVDVDLAHRFKVTASYYDIDYEDRVTRPGPSNANDILLQEAQWREVIHRGPSRAEMDAVCNDPFFRTSRTSCLATTSAAIVDLRQRNIARTKVDGVDVTLDTRFLPARLGEIGLSITGAYVLHYEVAVSETSPSRDLVDTIGSPASFRARGTASWTYQNWFTSVSLNHVGSYSDNRQTVGRSIEAWNTVDMKLGYRTVESHGLFGSLDISLTAANVLDQDPPFVNQGLGYDAASANPLGRFIGIQITKGWGGIP